jgi:hypothetical protein
VKPYKSSRRPPSNHITNRPAIIRSDAGSLFAAADYSLLVQNYWVLRIIVTALVSLDAGLSFSRVAAARRIPVFFARPATGFGFLARSRRMCGNDKQGGTGAEAL